MKKGARWLKLANRIQKATIYSWHLREKVCGTLNILENMFSRIKAVASNTNCQIFELPVIARLWGCGNLSKDLQKALAGFGAHNFIPFARFNR